jgi:hypothetical protein
MVKIKIPLGKRFAKRKFIIALSQKKCKNAEINNLQNYHPQQKRCTHEKSCQLVGLRIKETVIKDLAGEIGPQSNRWMMLDKLRPNGTLQVGPSLESEKLQRISKSESAEI